MKKSLKILTIIFLSAIILVGASILMSSDFCITKKAEWLKESYLRKNMPPEFQYLSEGIYGFEKELFVNETETNVFGEKVRKKKSVGTLEGQLSLKSDKIAIYYNGKIEEFTIQSTYKIPDRDTINSYMFVVKNHKAFENNICFYDETFPNNKFKRVYLELNNYSTGPMLWYKGEEADGTIALHKEQGFRTIEKKELLQLFETVIFIKNKIGDYPQYMKPKYTQSPFEDIYYDINSYKPGGYLYEPVNFWQLFTKP